MKLIARSTLGLVLLGARWAPRSSSGRSTPPTPAVALFAAVGVTVLAVIAIVGVVLTAVAWGTTEAQIKHRRTSEGE